MRKLSQYGRKLLRQQQELERQLQEKEREKAELEFLAAVQRDVRGLQIDAGLHCWAGNDASTLVNKCGRLLYIAEVTGA